MKTNYDKKCKECETIFTPYRTTDKLCFVCTKTRQAIKNLEKIKKARKKALKDDLMTLQDWFKIAQQHFNRYINLRDKGNVCISCQKRINLSNTLGSKRVISNSVSLFSILTFSPCAL